MLCKFNEYTHFLPLSRSAVLQKRLYAKPTSFPDYFQNPIFRKEDQAKLMESTELSKLAAVAVRPPAVYETCSAYHDPLVKYVKFYYE